MKFYSLFMLLVFSVSMSAQFDDLYNNPIEEAPVYTETVSNDYGSEYTYYDEAGGYDDYSDYEYLSDYDSYYSSRIRRFNRVNRCGFDYFHPYYAYSGAIDPFYDPFFNSYAYYNPFRNRGITILVGNRWGNRWYNPYRNYGWGGFANYYSNPYWVGGYGYNNYFNNGWNSCPPNYGGGWYANNGGWNNNAGYNYGSTNYDSGNGTHFGSRGGGSTSSSTAGLKDSPRSQSPKNNNSPNVYSNPSSTVISGGGVSNGRVLQTENGPVTGQANAKRGATRDIYRGNSSPVQSAPITKGTSRSDQATRPSRTYERPQSTRGAKTYDRTNSSSKSSRTYSRPSTSSRKSYDTSGSSRSSNSYQRSNSRSSSSSSTRGSSRSTSSSKSYSPSRSSRSSSSSSKSYSPRSSSSSKSTSSSSRSTSSRRGGK